MTIQNQILWIELKLVYYYPFIAIFQLSFVLSIVKFTFSVIHCFILVSSSTVYKVESSGNRRLERQSFSLQLSYHSIVPKEHTLTWLAWQMKLAIGLNSPCCCSGGKAGSLAAQWLPLLVNSIRVMCVESLHKLWFYDDISRLISYFYELLSVESLHKLCFYDDIIRLVL